MYQPFAEKKLIAFITSDFKPSQLSYYLINNINKFYDPNICFSVFTENLTPYCIIPKFAHFNISEAWGYDGILIATSLVTAHKLIDYPCARDKYFYVWDLEWNKGQIRNHAFYKSIYGNKNLKLIARNEYHKRAIQNCWNVNPVGCVNDVNLIDLLKIL